MRIHILPVGQFEPIHHASLQCWCHPVGRDQEAVHNALDGREKWERQGITHPERVWCLVYEDRPSSELKK